MTKIILSTIGMMVATFGIGLLVAYLIRLLSNILSYSEHGSLSKDIKAFRRLRHIKYIRREKIMKQMASRPSNEIISFYYGDN